MADCPALNPMHTAGVCPWALMVWQGSPHWGLLPFLGSVTWVVSIGSTLDWNSTWSWLVASVALRSS